MKKIVSLQIILLFLMVIGEFRPVFAEPESCLKRCIWTHPQWGDKQCREKNLFLVGKVCYAIYNDCLQQCNFAWSPVHSKVFIPPPEQLTDLWRQGAVCEPEVEIVPYEVIPGDIVIDPRWSGRCECLNGQLIEAKCGHKKASCQQVCNTGVTF